MSRSQQKVASPIPRELSVEEIEAVAGGGIHVLPEPPPLPGVPPPPPKVIIT